MATYYMYFPFLACEVKCGAAALDVADRQNARSMTLAARGIVELFRLVKREVEINRQGLSFSVPHDHSYVRIYGYYPVITREKTEYYRYPVHKFDITALDGKEKWTAYRFIKNVDDSWMPEHLERICSAIDQLPLLDIDFDGPAPSVLTGLSQSLGSHHLTSPEVDVALLPTGNGPSLQNARQVVTPDSTFAKAAPKRRNLSNSRPV
jgi:hypothetical protein